MKKHIMILLITLIIALSVGASEMPCNSADGLVIQYASVDVEDSAVGIGMLAFKKYVEDASGGAIKVDLYFNGQLGGDRQSAESILLGTLDMSVVDVGIMGAYNGAFFIVSMPYTFPTKQSCYNALDGELGEALLEKANEAGFHIWGWVDAGTRHIANSVKQINTISDLKGLKMRVPESSITVDFMKAFGTNPTPISFSETYTALQQHVVDGMENPIELLYTSKFMEVMNYLTLTAHTETAMPHITSSTFEQKLTDEQRKIIRGGAKAQQDANRKAIAESEAVYQQEMLKQGKIITELSDERKQEFVEAVKPVYEKYRTIIGENILEIAAKIK